MLSLALASAVLLAAASPAPRPAARAKKPAARAAAPVAKAPAVYFEQTATTTVDGKAGGAQRSRVYWQGKKIRLESGDTFDPLVLLLDLERDRGIRLDAPSKTAIVIDMEALRSESTLNFSMAGDVMGATDLRSSPLPGRREVAGYTCQGYRLRAGDLRLDVWVAPGVRVPMEAFTDLLEFSGAAQSLGELLPEIQKLPGFPLETRSRVEADGRVYESVARVTLIKTDPLPKSLFEPPAGYQTVLEPPPTREDE
jgi:hypothetical protein